MKVLNYKIIQLCIDLPLKATGVFLLYGVILLFSSSFTFEPSSTPLFWPANAIVLSIMLYASLQRAMIYMVSAYLSYFVYLYFYDLFGFIPSLLLASANLIEIGSGYFLLRWFTTKPLHFNRLRNTLQIIAYGIVLNSAVGATAGTVLMYSVWEAPTFINWSIWFGTSAIGYLMVLPLMISWMTPTHLKISNMERFEIAIVLGLCAVGSLLIFQAAKDQLFVYPYFAFPVLLWCGIRFDLKITSIAFLIFLIISAICSTQGLGPFAMGQFYREILLIRFHLFCGVTIITVLLVSALGSERNQLISDLQEAFKQIKTLKGIIPICCHCKKIRDDSGYWNQLESYIEKNSNAELTHGICPTCAKELYGEYYP